MEFGHQQRHNQVSVNNMKKAITSIIMGSMIIGGAVVGLQRPTQLTVSELDTLIDLYNYEIQQNGGHFSAKGDILQKLDDQILSENKSATIEGKNMNAEEYTTLKKTLILKRQQKTLLEQLL